MPDQPRVPTARRRRPQPAAADRLVSAVRTTRAVLPARVLAASAVLATALSLAGCSGSGAAGPTTSPSPSSSSQRIVSPVASPTSAQAAIPPDGSIVEEPELRKSVALTGCTSAPGGWQATGTARNPGTSGQTYHLLVFFTDRYSRTIDYGTTSVTVPAGGTRTWTARASFIPSKGTQCVLRGLYEGATRPLFPSTSAKRAHHKH